MSRKESAAERKKLKTTIKKLRSKLDRAGREAKRVTKKVARLEKAKAELQTRVKDLKKSSRRLERTPRPGEMRKPVVTEDRPDVARAPASDLGAASVAPSPTISSPAVSPDASWTVAQLRAEARSRGLTGISRKTKAELLAALG